MALTVTPTDEMKTLTAGGKIYEVVDDKARTELSNVKADLLQKANIDGAYSDLTAGNAEQLVSTVYEEDSVPYIFRTAGGSMDSGDREEDMIVGGTVAWNQLIKESAIQQKTAHGLTSVVNNHVYTLTGEITQSGSFMIDGSVPMLAGHKYIITGIYKNNGISFRIYGPTAGTVVANIGPVSRVISISVSDNYQVYFLTQKIGNTVDVECIPQLFDLTQDFGSTIADYIYSLEQANAGAGVAWFRKLFPADYYPYDAGTLKSVEGVSSHDMVGFNAYNPTTGTAKLVGGQQYQITGAYSALTFDGEAVTPDVSGYFTPSKNGTLTVTGGDSTTTCVHLVWDGERDGEYEPYVNRSYPLDSSLTLRGIPKLDSANNLYYDGDTYESDGTVTRRYREMVFNGTENWGIEPSSWNSHGLNAFYIVLGAGDRAYFPSASDVPMLICDKFVGASNISLKTSDKTGLIGFVGGSGSANYIEILSDATDVASFKTWLANNNTKVVYKLITPTTETAEPYHNPQIVDDFGTEEYVTTSIVPVGHVTKYQPNLRAKLEMSPDSPDGDGDYIVRQANGENSYVSLASTTTIQDILARLTALEGNTNEG